jgi:hypothetical protein
LLDVDASSAEIFSTKAIATIRIGDAAESASYGAKNIAEDLAGGVPFIVDLSD